MLAQLGFQVLTATNGREGLKAFRTHGAEITCVILDLMMPEMGGEETFLALRKLRSDVRVILSSGYNEQDVTQRLSARTIGIRPKALHPGESSQCSEARSRLIRASTGHRTRSNSEHP